MSSLSRGMIFDNKSLPKDKTLFVWNTPISKTHFDISNKYSTCRFPGNDHIIGCWAIFPQSPSHKLSLDISLLSTIWPFLVFFSSSLVNNCATLKKSSTSVSIFGAKATIWRLLYISIHNRLSLALSVWIQSGSHMKQTAWTFLQDPKILHSMWQS